ncbi:hypothetical protein K7432_004091 [Basidiobolus ranarum]|uniref:Uncharacterized protein n=1 Tax=Basidiobolus ranarum TaxID=34480 RepID=A0ABR2W663_9FUNG
MFKSFENKNSILEGKMQALFHDTNVEITTLKKKILSLRNEKEIEKRRGLEINEQYHEKLRQLQKLQALYDRLKRQMIVPTIQHNVHEASDASYHTTVTKSQPSTTKNQNRPRTSSLSGYVASYNPTFQSNLGYNRRQRTDSHSHHAIIYPKLPRNCDASEELLLSQMDHDSHYNA